MGSLGFEALIGDYFLDMGGGQVLEVRMVDGDALMQTYNKSAPDLPKDTVGKLVAGFDAATDSTEAMFKVGDHDGPERGGSGIYTFKLSDGLATSVINHRGNGMILTAGYVDGSREKAIPVDDFKHIPIPRSAWTDAVEKKFVEVFKDYDKDGVKGGVGPISLQDWTNAGNEQCFWQYFLGISHFFFCHK